MVRRRMLGSVLLLFLSVLLCISEVALITLMKFTVMQRNRMVVFLVGLFFTFHGSVLAAQLPYALHSFQPRDLGPEPPYVAANYVPYLSQTGATVRAQPVVHFSDGSNLDCSDSRDTVILYPETDYTRWFVEHYVEVLARSGTFMYPYDQSDSRSAMYPSSGYPVVSAVRVFSCGTNPLGLLARNVPVGDYLVLAFVHRYVLRTPPVPVIFTNGDATYETPSISPNVPQPVNTYVLFNEIHMRSGSDATYHLNGFSIIASY